MTVNYKLSLAEEKRIYDDLVSQGKTNLPFSLFIKNSFYEKINSISKGVQDE